MADSAAKQRWPMDCPRYESPQFIPKASASKLRWRPGHQGLVVTVFRLRCGHSSLSGFRLFRSVHFDVWTDLLHRHVPEYAGIVSFGKIGQAIADRARAFGVELLVYDPHISSDKIREKGARSVSKEEVLREADFLIMQGSLDWRNAALLELSGI
jgi:hypothetical protein